ncbi:MAG: hypothetical protein JWQ02_1207 [Capsulimonas sp.]|nr:hypothetical protein [Capsulimonas sp.]
MVSVIIIDIYDTLTQSKLHFEGWNIFDTPTLR